MRQCKGYLMTNLKRTITVTLLAVVFIAAGGIRASDPPVPPEQAIFPGQCLWPLSVLPLHFHLFI